MEDNCPICLSVLTIPVYQDMECNCSKVIYYCLTCFRDLVYSELSSKCFQCRKPFSCKSYTIDLVKQKYLDKKYGFVPVQGVLLKCFATK